MPDQHITKEGTNRPSRRESLTVTGTKGLASELFTTMRDVTHHVVEPVTPTNLWGAIQEPLDVALHRPTMVWDTIRERLDIIPHRPTVKEFVASSAILVACIADTATTGITSKIGIFNDPNRQSQDSKIVHADGGFDEIEALHAITQETRANLIQDMIAHPTEMPSLRELVFMNPSAKSQATIREHLGTLIDVGIVEQETLPEEKRSRDLPHKFYRITPEGWDLLEKYNLFISEQEELKEEYEQVDKPPEIREYENAPRPFVLA